MSVLLVTNWSCTKKCKVPISYNQDCLIFFFVIVIAFYTLNDDSTLGKEKPTFFWRKKEGIIDQPSLTKDESFLGPIFDLNETCEMLLT